MPFFSIVIPTRNRGDLLRYALRSALDQTFDDYEIVVCDNCSDDSTCQVVKELADRKIRYFRTDKVLSMTDNWEFAINQASGEWITILEDDDVISRFLLEKIHRIFSKIKELENNYVIVWGHAQYILPTHWEEKIRKKLFLSPYTFKIKKFNSNFLLKQLYKLETEWYWKSPTMRNSCCHRSIIEQVKRKNKLNRFFVPPFPDYSSAAVILSEIKVCLFLDMPLFISCPGQGKQDKVINCNDVFWKWFGQEAEHLLSCTPLSGITQSSGAAETLLRVKDALPEISSKVKLNWVRYFAQYYDYLKMHCSEGRNILNLKQEFFKVLKQQSKYIQLQVYIQMMIRTIGIPILSQVLSLKQNVFYGEDATFSNTFEARQHVDRYLIK